MNHVSAAALDVLGLMHAATAEAQDLGISVAVCVVDSHGRKLGEYSMPEAYLSAAALAEKKAFTAVNFGVPTHVMAERVQPQTYQVLVSAADPRLTFLKGGLALATDSGEVVGAVGVSGGTADQDFACCEAAAGNVEI